MTAEPCIRRADLIPVGDGQFAANWPQGQPTVLSIQRDGTWETRPNTAIGPWETGRLEGNKLVYFDSAYPQAYAVLVVG